MSIKIHSYKHILLKLVTHHHYLHIIQAMLNLNTKGLVILYTVLLLHNSYYDRIVHALQYLNYTI